MLRRDEKDFNFKTSAETRCKILTKRMRFSNKFGAAIGKKRSPLKQKGTAFID
ncbi:hypothetical protein Q7O_002477 [Pectobacterium carotovorum subsp. carotovorum PCCS1]|jgi:hypothetical protein|nr:hypothetical protein [Pectobacterium carotovorum subsp. carotovorum PCCS1]